MSEKIVSDLHRVEVSNKRKKANKKILNVFIEFFIVATLISLGSSAVVSGLIAIHFPCSGSACGEIAVAGGITLTIGSILIFVAAVIILWTNVLKD